MFPSYPVPSPNHPLVFYYPRLSIYLLMNSNLSGIRDGVTFTYNFINSDTGWVPDEDKVWIYGNECRGIIFTFHQNNEPAWHSSSTNRSPLSSLFSAQPSFSHTKSTCRQQGHWQSRVRNPNFFIVSTQPSQEEQEFFLANNRRRVLFSETFAVHCCSDKQLVRNHLRLQTVCSIGNTFLNKFSLFVNLFRSQIVFKVQLFLMNLNKTVWLTLLMKVTKNYIK